jgi:hypothetical protein
LAAKGGEHGIAGPVIISGWSAGGHLTAFLLDHPKVTAGLAISGVFELAPLRDSPHVNDNVKLTEVEIKTLSPMRLPGVNKPLAVTYGTSELPAMIDSSRDFHAYRAKSHLPGPLIPVVKTNHFTILEELRRPNGILTQAVLNLALVGSTAAAWPFAVRAQQPPSVDNVSRKPARPDRHRSKMERSGSGSSTAACSVLSRMRSDAVLVVADPFLAGFLTCSFGRRGLGATNTKQSALSCAKQLQSPLQRAPGERSCRKTRRELVATACRLAFGAKRFKWSKSRVSPPRITSRV